MNGDGMMDKGPAINGKKFLIGIIVGLIVFTLVSMFVTFGIGNYFGKVNSKKAMEHERAIDTQIMRDKENSPAH
jgi:gas vesicle protein